MSYELAFVRWPPLRLARLRCERGSVGVVSPAAPIVSITGDAHGRVIGIGGRKWMREGLARDTCLATEPR
jgi:hypothetical protein